MNSMTGFGQFQLEQNALRLNVAVKSVNGRFLDVRCTLPGEYDGFESEIKKRVSGLFSRGSVSIYINRVVSTTSEAFDLELNENLIEQITVQAKKMTRKFKLQGELNWGDLVSIPHVVQVRTERKNRNEDKVLFKALDQALKACAAERKREGDFLLKLLSEMLCSLEEILKQIRPLSHLDSENAQERLNQRLEKLGMKEKVDPSRIAQEVVMYLEKLDVSEELERLDEHLVSMKAALKENGALGKKLDFYTQELFREFNTIGSKTSTPGVTKLVVEAKVIVERIREQVQNIE